MSLPKSWPSDVRRIVLNSARYYYQLMNEEFPVPDVAMEKAIDWANRELDARQSEIRQEASSRWINRWESGQFDDDMRKAIEATYTRLRRGERGLRGGARKKLVKKRSAELEADIAAALSGRRR